MCATEAQLVDVSRHRLRPGPRSAYQADRSAADTVGKSQPDSVYDRSTAVRPHDKQTFFARRLLQRNFIFKRDVIAVKKNVLIEIKSFARDVCSIAARHGDQHPTGLRQLFHRAAQTVRTKIFTDTG